MYHDIHDVFGKTVVVCTCSIIHNGTFVIKKVENKDDDVWHRRRMMHTITTFLKKPSWFALHLVTWAHFIDWLSFATSVGAHPLRAILTPVTFSVTHTSASARRSITVVIVQGQYLILEWLISFDLKFHFWWVIQLAGKLRHRQRPMCEP